MSSLRRTKEQDVVAAKAQLATLKALLSKALRDYIDVDKNDPLSIRNATLACQQSASAYFNYAEEFVGNSDLLGAHASALWAQGFAEDCAEILKSMPDYFTFLDHAFSKLGSPVSRETLLPGSTAYANMQRMVRKYLTASECKTLRQKFEDSDLPVYGFDNEARDVMSKDHQNTGPSTWEKLVAFAFGLIFVVVMLYIALYVPNPTETQWFTFRVVLALAAAGVGAVIPGLLNVEAPPYVRAGGALALFVVVFWFNPPKLITSPPDKKPSLIVPAVGKTLHLVASVVASGTRLQRNTVPHPLSQGPDHHFYIDSESGNVNSHSDVCPLAEGGWEVDSEPFPGFSYGMTDREHVVATGDKYWEVSKLPSGCLRLYCDGRNGSSHVQIAQVFIRQKQAQAIERCHDPARGETDVRPGELKQLQLNLSEARSDCLDPTMHPRVEILDSQGKSVLIKDLRPDIQEQMFDGMLVLRFNSSGLLDIEYRTLGASM